MEVTYSADGVIDKEEVVVILVIMEVTYSIKIAIFLYSSNYKQNKKRKMAISVLHHSEIAHFSNPMVPKCQRASPIKKQLVFPKSDKMKIRDFLVIGNKLSISVCC